MKKNLKSSILAATSLTALTVQHQTEANTLAFTDGQLSALNNQNQLESSDASVLDFSKMTIETVGKLQGVTLDLSQFDKARNIILPWFASKLNIILPENFGQPQNDIYSRLTVVNAGVAPSTEADLRLDLSNILSVAGKVTVDSTAVAVKELISGSATAKIARNSETIKLNVSEKIEAIDTFGGVIADNIKTMITVQPSVTSSDQTRPAFMGLPAAVIGANPSELDISKYAISGGNVSLSGMTKLESLKVGAGENIGTLTVAGETSFTTNATSIQKAEVTSTTPVQSVVDALATVATSVAVQNHDAFKDKYKGSTNLDFSTIDFGSADATASRIKEIITDSTVAPLATIQTMKINSNVLNAVMSKLNITNLSSFSALKNLELISATGVYQTTTLIASDLPSGIEEFYSSNLVVRKGTLSADLEFDKKFNAVTLDLSGLSLNGHTINIGNAFTASSVTHLKLNPSLLAVAATRNLIAVGSAKTITVSGSVSGALNTANLQNVGTIDLRTVTGATSFSAPLDVDGNNSNLSSLYLPSAFDVEAADILSGVDNGEVTVYLSGAYSDAKTLDASYDKTILNFSGVTGTGRFQVPSGVRGLVLSNAVKGINVGATAVLNEFDLSGLTYIRQITDLPTSAAVLKLNNSAAASASELNLTALTSLTTLDLGSSRVSQLSLPASATLTNGGDAGHLDLSNITDLGALNGLNAFLALGSITTVSFPNNPASTLRINLVTTIAGLQFNNLDKIPELTLDSDYFPGSDNMWPTVKNKTVSGDWTEFFNYITGAVNLGGVNSPSVFDLSGQAIESQVQANALVEALNSLSSLSKNVIEKIIIRIDSATTGTIDLSTLSTTDFTHSSLKVIIDQSTGSAATVYVPAGWVANTKTYTSLSQVDKASAASWTNYLNYHFGSTIDKGEAATSLDLSAVSLTATQWTELMTSLTSFATPEIIETISLKLVAADNYSSAPEFTAAPLSAATSIIVDITGVKNSGAQVAVTRLPSATVNLQVEQRVTGASSVDRANAASWKGYVEKLLSTISGSSYTLDLTATDVQIQTAVELTALNVALAALSTANKAKIQNINLKIAAGDRASDFTVSTDFTDFTNITSLVVDATGALNGTAQSAVTFSLTNAPAYAKAHVTNLASVDTDVSASWDYYLAYRLATNGIGLANLDLSSISLAAQADLTAFLTSLEGQSGGDKSNVQSIKLKLATNYSDSTVNLNVGSISGLSHGSFAVEVDRNGANSTTPVSFTFGIGAGKITSSNTTIKDTAFTGLGSFDGENAHHWLGYVRTLLSTVASGTTTLDLSIHSALEMNNATLTTFITAMNALPAADKAKIDTLKIKLASGDFGASAADVSSLSGFTNLTSLIVDRNNARSSATLFDPAVNVTEIGTTTINDPELRTVSATTETNKWLGYIRFVLNGMSGTTNTLDLSSFSVDSANAATAFNNALQALPASEKDKIQTLKLSANTAVTLGTGVSGLTNLTTVIVNQTAAPTAAITIAAGSGATGELADAATQKFYVTSASTAQTNGVWAKYIDYVMSSTADGGLNQTAFDLTALTLSNAEIGQFLTALDASAGVADVTAISLKLAPSFGASTLDLSPYTGFSSLADDGVIIYRNGSSTDGSSAPVSITNGGSFTNAKVKIIDPTATTVTDTAEAQKWLEYLTGVLNDAASGVTLDLSSIAIDDAAAVTAFNIAVANLDSALANKVAILKLAVTHAADITLGTGSAGFSNLSRIEFTKTATNTLTFAGALSVGRTYLTNLASVKMDTSTDWSRYLNYMLSTTDGGQSATSLNLNSRTFADQAAVDAFFAGLHALSSKDDLTTLRMKLESGISSTLSIGVASSELAVNIKVIVDPNASTAPTAAEGSTSIQSDNLIVLDSAPAFSKGYIAYLAEQNGFNGAIDLTALSMLTADGATLTTALNTLPTDQKAAIKTVNLQLQSGSFGGADLQLGALTGFTGLTINVDRNGAIDGVDTYGSLVTVTNNTTHTVNLTDAEFHNMSTFNNESSANWIGYLTHELNSAPATYTLDLTVHSALVLDSANAVTALNEALKALPASLKAKAALLKVKSSTNGELGTNVTGFTNLTTIVIDYLSTGLNMSLDGGFGNTPTQYSYISTPFNVMDWSDWTKFFNYNLNSASIGGIEQTTISLDKRLSSADLTAVLLALDAASQKALLENLTLNLASAVVGDINVGASGLTAISTVTINTNGSVARLTPTGDHYDKFIFSSLLNVNPAVHGSWRAYLKGQSSIADIDIREVELGSQAQLTAFLTALDADSNKATVDTIKIKLASDYTGTVDFSVDVDADTGGTQAISGLTTLDDDGVEIHRNGSAATFVVGGDITDAKIKLVDINSDSLTDRGSASSWRGYLAALIEDAGVSIAIDLSLDSDTYLRTNDHVTAVMSGLQNLSPANKLLVTSLKLELASGAAWTNISDLGLGLTGFDSLTSFIVDATGATDSGTQATVSFHADLNAAAPKAIVSSLSSVDKDNQDSWTYYFNSAAMTSIDVSSITLNSTEATAFLAALGTGVTVKSAITALTMKLDPTFGAGSLAFDGTGLTSLQVADSISVHRNGAVNGGNPISVVLSNGLTTTHVRVVDPTITDAESVLKTSASSWLAYLTDALSGAVTELDLTDDNLVLTTAPQATALSTALDALDSALKAKIVTLKVKAAVNVTIGATLTTAAGFTALTAIQLDKPAANTITVSTIDATTKLHIADITNVKRDSATDWEYYLKGLYQIT